MNMHVEFERDAYNAHIVIKGNELLSNLLEYVRRGNCSGIETVLSEYLSLIQVFVGNDLFKARKSLRYVSTQTVRAAMDGGMSAIKTMEIYSVHNKKIEQIRSVPEALEIVKQIFFDFLDNVARVKEEYRFTPIVRHCRLYISEHIFQPLSVYSIAKALNISTGHLSRVFKHETGETVSDFIQHKKISEVKLLLQYTSFSLADIGQQLGYCSQSHFTRIFYKETGITPYQFRNKYKRLEPVCDNL